MDPLKTSMHMVTKEEVDRAADLWDRRLVKKVMAHQLGWTYNLLDRVIALSRLCDDGYFPHRNRQRTASEGWDDGVLAAAKKPATPTLATWKRALQERGLKPSTVPARRPSDYLTKRKITDPTLSLPRAS